MADTKEKIVHEEVGKFGINEKIVHEKIGKVGVLKDDVKEDLEEALEEKEIIETTVGD